jgi:hypothetical protein
MSSLCRYSDGLEVERSRNLNLGEKVRFVRELESQLGAREHAVIAISEIQSRTSRGARKGVSAINNLVCASSAAIGAS